MTLMIDWVTCLIPCEHPRLINGGNVVSIRPDGSIEWEVRKHLSVDGSHDASLQVRTDGITCDGERGSMLRIHGNPAKWLQGHNVFGSGDLVGLILEVVRRLVPILGLTPTAHDLRNIEQGAWTLTRADLTAMFHLPGGQSEVLAWIRAAEHSAHLRQRGRGVMKGGTLYYGKHSRRWSLKCYSKGQELTVKGHRLPLELETPEMLEYARQSLRVELVMRSLELKRQGLHVAANWTESATLDLFNERLQQLEMCDTHAIPPAALAELPARLVAVYHLWCEGHDIRAMYPKKTFYRYRSQLQEYGIDIAVKQPGEDRSNVVPLVRVLEAKPAGIPQWAYDRGQVFIPPPRGEQRPVKLRTVNGELVHGHA